MQIRQLKSGDSLLLSSQANTQIEQALGGKQQYFVSIDDRVGEDGYPLLVVAKTPAPELKWKNYASARLFYGPDGKPLTVS